MKKRLFSSVLAVMLVAICALCLTACGDDSSKVSLHGKTYTLGTEVTWSYYLKDANGNKTPITDMAAYIDENNLLAKFKSNLAYLGSEINACENGQDVVTLVKTCLEDPDNEICGILLKGAVITVSEGKKAGETTLSSNLECTMGDKPLVQANNIYIGIGNQDEAHFAESTISSMSEFKLTDYDENGSINNIYAKLVVAKGEGFITYSNVTNVSVHLESNNKDLVIEASVNLASVK